MKKRAQPRVKHHQEEYIHSITPDNISTDNICVRTRENIYLCLTLTPLCSLESAGSPRMKHQDEMLSLNCSLFQSVMLQL